MSRLNPFHAQPRGARAARTTRRHDGQQEAVAKGSLKVRDVMTADVLYLPADATLNEAARAMRERDVGDVVVTDGPTLAGIVTDRDIVVRAVAERKDPARTSLGDIASRDLVLIEQDASAREAADVMHSRSVRRLLVCDADRQLVGIVSLADLTRASGAAPAAL